MDEIEKPVAGATALGFGWKKTTQNLGPLLALGGFSLVVSWLDRFVAPVATDHRGTVLLMQVGTFLLQQCVTMAYVRAALRMHDGQPIELSRVGRLLAGFLNYLLTTILYGLIVMAGLVLLIVPGVIWGLQFMFAPFAAVDGNVGPIEALRQSSRLTRGVKGRLFWFAVLAVLVNILGAIPFGLGLLVTVPTAATATAYLMRRLQQRAAQPSFSRALPIAPAPTPLPTH